MNNNIQLDGTTWKLEFGCGQWEALTQRDDDNQVVAYCIVNRSPTGQRQFYDVIAGKFGEPLMRKEPDQALPVPSGLQYVRDGAHVVPDQRIAGCVVKDGSKVIERFSITNAIKKGRSVTLSDMGELTVDGNRYFLTALFSADRNRVKNYDAFFSTRPETGPPIRLVELEDLF
jgi:hypothetical protein